jgi:Transposase domain (DUF772)
MSMHPQAISPIPEETVRVARAAFPRGNPYMTMRDQLGPLYDDQDFAALFSKRGRPAEAPWQLALVCVFQFMEGLSDRQAAEAVRSRIDWKYALGLDLADPGFDYSVLSRISSAADRRGSRDKAPGHHARAVQSVRSAQSTWEAANRLHACTGGHSYPQPTRKCRRDPAGCAQRRGHCGSRLASGACCTRVI